MRIDFKQRPIVPRTRSIRGLASTRVKIRSDASVKRKIEADVIVVGAGQGEMGHAWDAYIACVNLIVGDSPVFEAHLMVVTNIRHHRVDDSRGIAKTEHDGGIG